MAAGGCGGDDETAAPDPGGTGIFEGYDPADLGTPDTVRMFAGASAPAVFASAISGALLGGVSNLDSTSKCPGITQIGTKTTYTGGCTDSDGNTWFGVAVIAEGETDGEGSIRYDGFGLGQPAECTGGAGETRLTYDGTVTLTREASDTVAFAVSVTFAAATANPQTCAAVASSVAYDYHGTFVQLDPGGGAGGAGSGGAGGGSGGAAPPQGGITDHTRWNGSGRIGVSTVGYVDATTTDELLDSTVCADEAASGTTRITSGSDVAVLTYDGATKCDDTSTVPWTYDGKAQPELTNVRCAVGAAPGAPSGLAGAGLFAAAVAAALHRRRRA